MRTQLELFLTALAFFTRIPIPGWVAWSPQRLNHSARYFPLVGWVVGAICALCLLGLAQVLPPALSVLLSIALSLRLTGAFHEDGWADSCDGLGGGWDKMQVLDIMKDSRIGTYGAAGLFLMLAIKAAALIELARHAPSVAALALLVAHPLSRLASTSLICTLDYVREDTLSKAKPLAHTLSRNELAIAASCGLLPLLLLSPASAGLTLIAVALITLWMARMFLRRLGGYTGDCLGAVQQVSEVTIYIVLVGSWNFI